MSLRKLNLIFGVLLFCVFLGSGFYMSNYFKPMHIEALTMRMQIRSSHLYMLFVSLLNIISYKCVFQQNRSISKVLEFLFRVCFIVAGFFSVLSFIKEHTGDLALRNHTLLAAILCVTAVGFVVLNELLSFLVCKRMKKNKC